MPARAPVLALEDAAATAACKDAFGVPCVDSDALRAPLLEDGFRLAAVHSCDGITLGNEESDHRYESSSARGVGRFYEA